MKILIAIEENKGADSKLSMHFGHCPFFAIFDSETENIEFIENKLDHSNPDLTPVDQIMKLKPDIVFSLGMGRKAINLFNKAGVKLKTGNFRTVGEVIKNIDKLKELDESCAD